MSHDANLRKGNGLLLAFRFPLTVQYEVKFRNIPCRVGFTFFSHVQRPHVTCRFKNAVPCRILGSIAPRQINDEV